MVNRKDRRHSGYVCPGLTVRAKRKFIIDNCLEPVEYYDDWSDYRDGQRDTYNDNTLLKRVKSTRILKSHFYGVKRQEPVDINEHIKNHERLRKIRKETRKTKTE